MTRQFGVFLTLLLAAETCGFSPSIPSKVTVRKICQRQRTTPLAVGSLPDFLFSKRPENKNDFLVSGVDAALLLGDKKRQSVFKQDLGKQFPWIPPGVLDICMDALSTSFDNVTPCDLKKALKPGGLEKVRPKIEASVVKSLKTQQMIQDIPLSEDGKNKLLQNIVKLSLDYLLEDAQAALIAPALKLQTLEREQSEIRRYMTFWQVTWYRLRHFPIRSIGFVLLLGWTVFLTFQYYKNTALISSLIEIANRACTVVSAGAQKVATLATAASKR